MKNIENLNFNNLTADNSETVKLKEMDTEKRESIPCTLFHGSSKKFENFRTKGRKPKELRAKGRKCVYLHQDREVTKRKYAKDGGYLYELSVKNAKNYSDAIEEERLHSKTSALTRQVWIALPDDIIIEKRWKIESDGQETLEYCKDGGI